MPNVEVYLDNPMKADETLFRQLRQRIEGGVEPAPITLARIGDCEAPAIIAAAVFAGHR